MAGGHLFDVHAALSGADKRHAAGLTIHQQGEVQFCFDARAVFDVDAVDLFACGASLVRDQGAAQHLFGFIGGLFNRLGQTHTARITSVGFFEFTFAAATGVNLGFYHPKRAVHFASSRFCIFGAQHNAAIRNRRPIRAQQCFGLVFMNIHNCLVPFGCIGWGYTIRYEGGVNGKMPDCDE